MNVVSSSDPETEFVERRGVRLAAAQDRRLANAGEMPREQAADHAGADYADALDRTSRTRPTARAASSRGSSCHRDPGSAESEKISRSSIGSRQRCQVSYSSPMSAPDSAISAAASSSELAMVQKRAKSRWIGSS